MSLSEILSAEILPRVEKPSRYLGAELNSVHKDLAPIRLRACLAFPDSYDLGLGNLGLQILYHILNQRQDIWAERVCAPHPDLEAELRGRGLPLFSLESQTPLREFDLLGFTLQWELTYTNLLNMLDLGGVPPLAADRGEDDPVVVAGGPCGFNPEPLALFVDCLVLGDGEEVVLELADALLAGGGRRAVLARLAAIPGCYVPALYPLQETATGLLVPPPDAPRITRRLVRDLDATPFPTDYLVPYTAQVHDRVGLEVLRGCTQGCRFCQAGMVTRPVRERSLTRLAELQQETMRRTGYEEISLVSLSTCDYSQVKTLAKQAADLAQPDHISVSLPSLRLDSFSIDLAHQLSTVRKTGLTFAPEAATDRLRAVINKFISREELLAMSRHCFELGWDQIKLYFMIGLPTETDEDVLAIADLAREVWELGRSIRGPRAKVNLGVSTFVPKPHTPFQWAAQIPPEEARRRQQLLHGRLRNKSIKFGRHDAFETYLEGVLTRGDRRMGHLIHAAWRHGARFDGWYEYRRQDAWEAAFSEWSDRFGQDPRDELRERDPAEPLPWDHLDTLIPKAWLQHDWDRARGLQWQVDCRREEGRCNQCGVIHEETAACTAMLRRSREGARAEAELRFDPPEPWAEPAPVGRMRFRWSRVGLVRLLSHKELMNAFIRAIRRARLPIRYSEGFHPHASLSFTTALPVGLETEGDYCDVTLTEQADPAAFGEALNAALPAGFAAHETWFVPLDEPALMATYDSARYRAVVPRELLGEDPAARLAAYLAQPSIEAQRRGKQQGQIVHRPLDIRPMVRTIAVTAETADEVTLELLLVAHDGRPPKLEEVLTTLLGRPAHALGAVRSRKLASLQAVGDDLVEPRPRPLEQV